MARKLAVAQQPVVGKAVAPGRRVALAQVDRRQSVAALSLAQALDMAVALGRVDQPPLAEELARQLDVAVGPAREHELDTAKKIFLIYKSSFLTRLLEML